MVQQIHNIQKTHLLPTFLQQVSFCSVHTRYLHISKTISFGHFHTLGTAFTTFLFTSHTLSMHFLDFFSIWKELKQLHSQDQCCQQPRTKKPLIQIPPPPEEFLTEVREQLIVFSSTDQVSPIHDIQQECRNSQVFETEQLLFLHTPNVFIEWTYSPFVICNDCAFTKFIQGEERCLKFINQGLTFLQSSSIPSLLVTF